nr:MAG TPA: hypothetical protein [Caudoviricetes sp.]
MPPVCLEPQLKFLYLLQFFGLQNHLHIPL